MPSEELARKIREENEDAETFMRKKKKAAFIGDCDCACTGGDGSCGGDGACSTGGSCDCGIKKPRTR